MDIFIERDRRTNYSTISKCFINGVFECFIIEDVDRGLRASMTLDEINKRKVKGKTAIPAGRYEVIVDRSIHFKKDLPLLLDVPGYEGIRIHPGNTAADTEGCLLPGTVRGVDMVMNSRTAFTQLFEKIKTALSKKEKIYITLA